MTNGSPTLDSIPAIIIHDSCSTQFSKGKRVAFDNLIYTFNLYT